MSGTEGGAPAPPATTAEEELVRIYHEQVGAIVRALRSTADHLAEKRVRTDLKDLQPDFLCHAGEVLHDVHSMIGNIQPGALIDAAEIASLAVRGER